jgi:hypothetical protein
LSGLSPNFDDWRRLSSIKVWEIAALIHGFDPRAAGDVAFPDPGDPTSPHGVPPDLSWEIRRLTSAIRAGGLTTAPTGIAAPNDETEILKTSLVSWLRTQGCVDLADELDTSSPLQGSGGTKSTVPINGTNVVWTAQRKSEAKTMLASEKASGVRAYAANTAKHFGVTPARLRDVLSDKSKKIEAKKQVSQWHP